MEEGEGGKGKGEREDEEGERGKAKGRTKKGKGERGKAKGRTWNYSVKGVNEDFLFFPWIDAIADRFPSIHPKSPFPPSPFAPPPFPTPHSLFPTPSLRAIAKQSPTHSHHCRASLNREGIIVGHAHREVLHFQVHPGLLADFCGEISGLFKDFSGFGIG